MDYSKLKLKSTISQNYAKFELNFALRNVNRGEGDIIKPSLIISAEGNDKKYEIESYTTKDSGSVIHVRGYGIVNEVIKYIVSEERMQLEDSKRDTEILKFLNINRGKLKFEMQGYPYKKAVILRENNA